MSPKPPDSPAAPSGDGHARQPRLLRELSEQAVLETILHDGPITRPEIAEKVHLSKPTVSAAVSRLERADLVHAAGRREGRRGRQPMAFVVSQQAGFVVGLDIGGANLRVGAASIYGDVLDERTEATAKENSRAMNAQILELVGDLIQQTRRTHGEPLALGISTPGVVDQNSGKVTSLANNVSPEGRFDPGFALGARFSFPVLVENNVNLAAVGEKWNGAARGASNFVFISIGAGIGMGISIEGELIRGSHGAAGEICYIPSGSDPFAERHRVHGGLEDEVGEAGILAAAREVSWPGAPPESAHEVFDAAERGEPAAIEIVTHVAERLAFAITMICAVVDPELVVLGGGIGSNDALIRPVRSGVAGLLPIPARIETSHLKQDAALYGAMAIALRAAREAFLTQQEAAPAKRAG